jgi:hypothetical protein
MSIMTGLIIILIELLLLLFAIDFLPRRWYWTIRFGLALMVSIITHPIARAVNLSSFPQLIARRAIK